MDKLMAGTSIFILSKSTKRESNVILLAQIIFKKKLK